MPERIERAARALNEAIVASVTARKLDMHVYDSGIELERRLARALADAGLLAPGPLAEEWVPSFPSDPKEAANCCGSSDRDAVAVDAELTDCAVLRRYVTEWRPADA